MNGLLTLEAVLSIQACARACTSTSIYDDAVLCSYSVSVAVRDQFLCVEALLFPTSNVFP